MVFLLLATPVLAASGNVLPGNMTDAELVSRVRLFFCTPHGEKTENRVLGFHNGLEVIVEVRPDRKGKEPTFAIVHYRKKAGADCVAAGGTEFYAGFPVNGAYSGVPAKKYCGAPILVKKNLGNYWLLPRGAEIPESCSK